MFTTLYYFTCESGYAFASTEYQAVLDQRNSIDAEEGGCPEAHPVRNRRVFL